MLLAAGCGDDPQPRVAAASDPRDSFDVAAKPQRPAVAGKGRWLVAKVKRRTWLRDAPSGQRVATLGGRTEFGSPRVLGVVSRSDDWLEVIATERPNRRTGWIPAGAASLSRTDVSVEIDRSRRRARLLRGRRVVRSFAVAVGREGNETPLGRYAVTDRLRPEDPNSVYGCCAVALSGHQTRLEPGWIGGDRLAIHGTPAKWSIGQAVSLGCMRAARDDIETLMRRVPLGAPVFIRG